MRHIVQGNEPTSFQNCKKANVLNNWDDFSKPTSPNYRIYSELRKTLIEQQDTMCCYCEVTLARTKYRCPYRTFER